MVCVNDITVLQKAVFMVLDNEVQSEVVGIVVVLVSAVAAAVATALAVQFLLEFMGPAYPTLNENNQE